MFVWPLLLFLSLVYCEKQKGVNFLNGEWSPPKFDSGESHSSFQALGPSGTKYLALTFCWYQWNISTTDIYAKTVSPTDAQITSITKLAHASGTKVMVRPLVDPDWSNPETRNTWRGEIGSRFSAATWPRWFDSYSAFLLKYARLATTIGADEFSVGGELVTAAKQTKYWRPLIEEVRKIYKGPIVYCANHGNEDVIDWWDAVDYIGVDAYYDLLPNNPNPTLDQLVSAWTPIKSGLESLSKKYNKPVLFTEIGFCSKPGANTNPAACSGTDEVSQVAQANLYESVFRSFWHEDWFQGIFWWAWTTNPSDGGANDKGFSPRGKQAEQVMKKYYQ